MKRYLILGITLLTLVACSLAFAEETSQRIYIRRPYERRPIDIYDRRPPYVIIIIIAPDRIRYPYPIVEPPYHAPYPFKRPPICNPHPIVEPPYIYDDPCPYPIVDPPYYDPYPIVDPPDCYW
jgi:hypothetical protein